MFQLNYKTFFLSAERKFLSEKVLDVCAVAHLGLEELECTMRLRSDKQHGSENLGNGWMCLCDHGVGGPSGGNQGALNKDFTFFISEAIMLILTGWGTTWTPSCWV